MKRRPTSSDSHLDSLGSPGRGGIGARVRAMLAGLAQAAGRWEYVTEARRPLPPRATRLDA